MSALTATGTATVNLGSNYGTATITAVAGGASPAFTLAIGSDVPDSVHTLANGDILNYTAEWIVGFGQTGPGQATDATLFFTIQLDDPAKLFPASTVFIAYSMDRNSAGHSNGFLPGPQLGAPDPLNPATRSDYQSAGVPLALQPDGSYRATIPGISEGRIFPLIAASNTISFTSVANIGTQGIGFALAFEETADTVPEPATIGVVGLGVGMLLIRRWRNAANPMRKR